MGRFRRQSQAAPRAARWRRQQRGGFRRRRRRTTITHPSSSTPAATSSLYILGAEALCRSNLSSFSNTVHQTSVGSQHSSAGQGVPVLNEDLNLITDANLNKGNWTSDSMVASEPQASGSMSKCTLCLSACQYPTATPWGHIFCWNCIMEWCNEKPKCPVTPVTHSSLVCIYH